MFDVQVKTSDEEIYFKKPVEKVNLVQPASEWVEVGIVGQSLKCRKLRFFNRKYFDETVGKTGPT